MFLAIIIEKEQFMTEKAAKVLEKRKKKSVFTELLPGAAGGTVGTIATMPIDNIKDTLKQYANQAAEARTKANLPITMPAERVTLLNDAMRYEKASKNLWGAAKTIYKGQGPKGFWRGTSGSLLKIAPAFALTFAVGDVVRNKMNKNK